MILIQIVLTIIAAYRGWKWFALLPIAVLFIIAFNFGIYITVSHLEIDKYVGVLTFLDAVASLVLLWMVIKGRTPVEE